jgi:predicted DNA binding CopG/RHH family protein
MPTSAAQKKANIAYNRRQDSITLRPTKEDGAKVRAAAAESGQSLQRYIMQACAEKMARDGFQPPDDSSTGGG